MNWPLITADEEGKHIAHYVATIKLGDDLDPAPQYLAMKQFLASHPEQYLFAFVTAET